MSTIDKLREFITKELSFLKTNFGEFLRPDELFQIDSEIEIAQTANESMLMPLVYASKIKAFHILQRMAVRRGLTESKIIHEYDLVYVRQFPDADGTCVVCHLNGAEITDLMTEEQAIKFAENYTE